MVAYEKMVKDMMHCDGRKVNCDTCGFREHPDCRNAMSKHAGALIQLQDVVIANQASMVAAVVEKRDRMQGMAMLNGRVLGEMGEILDKLAADLSKERYCPTCEHCAPEDVDEQPEVCRICMTPDEDSRWELAKRYKPERAKPEEPEEDSGDEGVERPVAVTSEQA